jgi:hypothetical protein
MQFQLVLKLKVMKAAETTLLRQVIIIGGLFCLTQHNLEMPNEVKRTYHILVSYYYGVITSYHSLMDELEFQDNIL